MKAQNRPECLLPTSFPNPAAAGPGPHFENHWPEPQSHSFLLVLMPLSEPPPQPIPQLPTLPPTKEEGITGELN